MVLIINFELLCLVPQQLNLKTNKLYPKILMINLKLYFHSYTTVSKLKVSWLIISGIFSDLKIIILKK